MENLMELDVLDEKIARKSIVLSPPDLTRALETIWDLFFHHFGPRVNVIQGGANLAQLTMTALFYRQDALTGPNLTQRRPNLAQTRATLQ